MDTVKTQELQSAMAMALYESIDATDWQKAALHYGEVGSSGKLYLDLTFLDGHVERVKKLLGLSDLLRDLRRAMATPDHGTWFSTVLTLSHEGSYSYEFNYEELPDWGRQPGPSIKDYVMDLDRYPRPAEEVPSSYPTVAKFRIQLVEKIAETAAGTDWKKVTVRCVDPQEGELEVTAELADGELRPLDYDWELAMDFSDLLGVMLYQGHERWGAATVDRNGNFEFSE